MDVVVPHTRTMADMLEMLDVIVADDPDTRGDFWRVQPWVEIPKASTVRPESYLPLAPADGAAARKALAGKWFGVPRMYVNADPEAGMSEHPGIGGSTGQRIETREFVIDLCHAAKADLEAAGADVVLVDFPVVHQAFSRLLTTVVLPPEQPAQQDTNDRRDPMVAAFVVRDHFHGVGLVEHAKLRHNYGTRNEGALE
jgi:Asp-tRNA(Asn)/Glu-tRNA(Gln) amidotransferase A subunit family amidase